MRLKIFRSLWGYPGSLAQAVEMVSASSLYDGIEADLPLAGPEREELLEAVDAADVGFIPLLTLEAGTPGEQLEELQAHLASLASIDCQCIVVHGGLDRWSPATAIEFYASAVEIEREHGARAAHETHRMRPLATPWATATILEAVPELGLCSDFSHWALVCERLLEDQEEAVSLACSRTVHLHARVGSDQAPQVVDPSAETAATQLAAFERWWDRIWACQLETGVEVSTLTPEYGPPPYQPSTGTDAELARQLVANCDWQAARERERFERIAQ